MDINCTNDCAHQSDGKCWLTELTPGDYSGGRSRSGGQDVRCPYYARKSR
ncbi:MAG: hypothetical protein LBS19_12260 [Clostridiales bacterium]|nr:hypothetical protein [Clostridiales bacterium]